MDIFEAKQRVAQIIEENQKQIIEVGEHIWKNPEPGYREFNTSAYLV